jgi:sigma-B regulation protein RsbU (phosphoserine phosphatase)
MAAESVSLAPGDILLLYTDGITEARNRQAEQFGSERLAALVRENPGLSARELVQALRQQLHSFADGQPLSDDTTVVACKIDGQPA